MQTQSRYSLPDFLSWSRYEILFLFAYNSLAVFFFYVINWRFMQAPYTPIALLGTAVAFLIGFQSNSAYGRIWEARKIWGAIVNTSRTFGMKVIDMITNEYTDDPVSDAELKNIHKTMIYRHIAWLTALRYAMRQPRPWEDYLKIKSNREYATNKIYIPEKVEDFKTEMSHYLSPDELEYVMSKGNKQTTVLFLQSKHLRELKQRGLLWEFSFLNMEEDIELLFDHQGRTERIKNFPYPKQFSSLSFYVVWVFNLLLPFGLMTIFDEMGIELAKKYAFGQYFIWSLVPFATIVSWIFWVIQRVSMEGDNPFESTPNDVPISAISRAIEIDLRQQLGEDPNEIPKPFLIKNHIEM